MTRAEFIEKNVDILTAMSDHIVDLSCERLYKLGFFYDGRKEEYVHDGLKPLTDETRKIADDEKKLNASANDLNKKLKMSKMTKDYSNFTEEDFSKISVYSVAVAVMLRQNFKRYEEYTKESIKNLEKISNEINSQNFD